jgi:hypothetical protein
MHGLTLFYRSCPDPGPLNVTFVAAKVDLRQTVAIKKTRTNTVFPASMRVSLGLAAWAGDEISARQEFKIITIQVLRLKAESCLSSRQAQIKPFRICSVQMAIGSNRLYYPLKLLPSACQPEKQKGRRR